MVDKNIFSFWFCLCINCKQRFKVWSPKVMTGRGIDQLNIYIYIYSFSSRQHTTSLRNKISTFLQNRYVSICMSYIYIIIPTHLRAIVWHITNITCIWADSRVRVVVKWELARTALFETVFQHLQTLNHIFNETSGRFPGMFVVTEKHYMISS